MPIQDNVIIVRKGGENDGEELGAFFTSTSPRHSVAPHGLVLDIGEAVEPTSSFEIVTHVLEVSGLDIQNGLTTYKHLDEELASLQKMSRGRIRKQFERTKTKLKTFEAEKELPFQKDWWAIGNQGHSCQFSLRQRIITSCEPSCKLI